MNYINIAAARLFQSRLSALLQNYVVGVHALQIATQEIAAACATIVVHSRECQTANISEYDVH